MGIRFRVQLPKLTSMCAVLAVKEYVSIAFVIPAGHKVLNTHHKVTLSVFRVRIVTRVVPH